MTGCGAIGNGDALGGAGGLNVFDFDFETTDAAPVLRTWGQLPVDGAAILYEGRVTAEQDDGSQGQYAFAGGTFARNATGTGALSTIAGGNAYTTPGAPWATIGAPVPPWTMILVDVVGPLVRINMAGAAATRVRWSGWIIRRFVGGATP